MPSKHFVAPLHIKSIDEENGVFIGYGAVFGNRDSYGDVILPGAFKNFLANNKANNVKLLWQHNSDQPIGIYEDIYEDENGLHVKGKLLINDVAQAREAYALLKAGALSGLSIGYTINQGGYRFQDGLMYLSDINLWEVSIVTFPANPLANIDSVKAEQIKTVRDFENCLRDVGFSANQAKRIASHGFKAFCDQRDADAREDAELIEALKQLNQKLISKG